jgi:hypothetical protein
MVVDGSEGRARAVERTRRSIDDEDCHIPPVRYLKTVALEVRPMFVHSLAVIIHDERQREIEATLERRGAAERAREEAAAARLRQAARLQAACVRPLPQDVAAGPAA